MDDEVAAVSVLELAWRTRAGGGGRTERGFGDFIIDGVSLYDRLVDRGYDLVAPLGWPHGDALARQRLCLEQPLLIAGTWEPLMVCAECGEATCGCVVAHISARRGLVTWNSLRWYDGHDVTDEDLDIGPVHFEFHAYRRALTTLS
jgi:hypothetical protein